MNHNYYKYWALAIITSVFLFACSPKEVYLSAWQDTPVNNDGIAKEWEFPLRFFDSGTMLNYTITNDKDNLYFCIRTADEFTQTKIIREGLQLYLDTTGKKQPQVGILYPVMNKDANEEFVPRKSQSNAQSGEAHVNIDANRIRRKMLTLATQMQLTGFKSPIAGLTPISNKYGIKANMTIDSSGVLIYELTVPFKTFYHQDLTKADALKKMSLMASVNPLPRPAQGRGPAMAPTINTPGTGMGGGMSNAALGMAGSRGGYQDPKSPLYVKKSFWALFNLSLR